MNSTTPPSAMSQGGTFVRPGAMAWGLARREPASPAAIEHALAAAATDPGQVTGLLDELSRGRLWVPLPDERPVTDGSAVRLPTVTYLGAEFVPAFTSARRLAAWVGAASGQPPQRSGDGPFAAMPHIVVPAADLASRMPPGVGIALNPGAEASVPIYPEGVGHLAAPAVVAEIRAALHAIPQVSQASRAWLPVPGQGERLVVAVSLQDPSSDAGRKEVISALEQATTATGFPLDVMFPGEDQPGELDEWISAHGEPFYLRA